MLRSLPRPLVSHGRYKLLLNILDIIKSTPPEPYTATEMASLFVNAVFCSLNVEFQNILVEILDFLCLVIKNEEKSKMGARNIAIIFGGIIFEPPATLDYATFMSENALQGQVVELILTCFIRYRNIFTCTGDKPKNYYSLNSRKLQSQYILRGEIFIAFLTVEDRVYGLFRGQIHIVQKDRLDTDFSPDPLSTTANVNEDKPEKPLVQGRMSVSRKSSMKKRLSMKHGGNRKSMGVSNGGRNQIL